LLAKPKSCRKIKLYLIQYHFCDPLYPYHFNRNETCHSKLLKIYALGLVCEYEIIIYLYKMKYSNNYKLCLDISK